MSAHRLILAAILFASNAPASAERAPPPPPADLATGLAGTWTGSLGYRDYQSNTLFELPVKTEIRSLSDGVTVLRISDFDDGPKAGIVTITTASLHDRKAGTVTSVSLRKGRKIEADTEKLTVAAYTDPLHWTIRAEQDGEDDDKPALLRVTEVRDGNTLTATKEVQPKGSAQGWQVRNVTKLVRQP